MTTISVTAKTEDRGSLIQARDFLDTLISRAEGGVEAEDQPSLNPVPATDSGPWHRPGRLSAEEVERMSQDPRAPELAMRIATDFIRRTTPGPHVPIINAASRVDGFTLRDLVKATGESMPQIKSRWANLGRSVGAAEEAVPGALPIFVEIERREDGAAQFQMPDLVRRAVRELLETGEEV